jgi:puromycin-sensitive aminopeptidase
MSEPFRLPTGVAPRRYDLTISPDLDASTFEGRVVISVDVLEATDEIVLHAKDLTIHAAAVDGSAATVTHRPDVDQLVLAPGRTIGPGNAVIEIVYGAEISHGLLGFYRSTFTDTAGNEHVLAATQFEAPHARAAFPCFDEPAFKAVFGVTLEVADGLSALSNGPEIHRESIGAGRVRVTFGDTISMSTYLVAWVVGPLEVTEPVDAGGVAVRVAHAPGKAHLTKFALDVGCFAIQFFADYYGIPYPGEKCDLVALPDFSFGAMENLGCVTFRETRLLLDPEQSTLDEMSGAALTIVHEIAHMWFGDLVTMKWWNGIWLNEAFATFMEHLGLDAYKPEWRTWDSFALGRAAALDVDALDHTRTVEYEVRTPEDADGMFDVLTYQKGGSVLRMLERWLGADAFRAGVREYLSTYQLSNTETTDLWDALEQATGQPVRRIMDSWIFQPGFPALYPDESRVVQRRFAYEASGAEHYAVPLLMRVHDGDRVETRTTLLATETASLDLGQHTTAVLNAGGEGFYRVAYPVAWRTRLLAANVLAPLERFTLVDDLWALVLAGDAAAAEFVDTARQFADETDLVVWRGLSGSLRASGRLVEGDALRALQRIVAELVGPSIERLGWEAAPADDDRTCQLRGTIISMLGAFVGDPRALERARAIVAKPQGVDADVAAASVNVVASVGTTDDFELYLKRSADAASSPQEQLRYLYALGDFPERELVLRAVEHAVSPAVRPQNAPFVLQRALRNREQGPAAWEFVRDHWDEIRKQVSGSLAVRMIEGVTWLVDDKSATEIPAFLDAHPIPEATRTIAQHMDRLRVHRAAVERERARFSAALLSL